MFFSTVKTALSNSFTKVPRGTYPKLPPWSLEPGSAEYFFAASSKLNPFNISFFTSIAFSKDFFIDSSEGFISINIWCVLYYVGKEGILSL